jgi:hypothetical protein
MLVLSAYKIPFIRVRLANLHTHHFQANGFPKELYEPFWDDLSEDLQAKGRNIRSIWIADMATHGQSGIINEKLLGPDGESHATTAE